MPAPLTTLPGYRDGDFSTPVRISRTPRDYPFRHLGDVTTAIYQATYLVDPARFTPTAGGTVDPETAGFYLVAETKPVPFGGLPGYLWVFTRTYASVPGNQTIEDTVMVTRPSPNLAAYPGVLGSYRIFQPDTTLQKYDAYAAQTVLSDSGAPSFYPTGGTYTLTIFGQTTSALNYNATAADVQTALNALSEVAARGNCVVTGSYNSAGGFTITFNSYAAFTIDTSSLTFTGGGLTSIGGSTAFGGYDQLLLVASVNGSRITGGTYTITIFGQTTAPIAYNASAATVQAALNALSQVAARGNCVVAGFGAGNDVYVQWDFQGGQVPAPFNLYLKVSFTNAVFTGTSSLTPQSTVNPALVNARGSVQTVKLLLVIATRTLTLAAHGIVVGDAVYLKAGGTYYPAITDFVVPSTDVIVLNISPSATYAAAGTVTEVGKRTKQNYKPGAASTLISNVTRFSLAAITPDTFQGDDATLLQEIFGGNTGINYHVGDSTRWPSPESAIRSLTTTKVSAANL